MDYYIIKHADRKKHKYIAKIKLSPRRYRYFYDLDAYKAYLQNKKSEKMDIFKNGISDKFPSSPLKTTAEKLSKTVVDPLSKLTTVLKSEQKTISKETVEKLTKQGVKLISELTTEKTKKDIDTFVNKKKDISLNAVGLMYDKKQVDKIVNFVSDTIKDLSSKLFKKEEPKKEESSNKTPNALSTKEEYQASEPEFMKDVPEVTRDMTTEEHMAEINEEYNMFVDERSMNCMYCTTAYELRKRGYDVQAADFPGDETYQGSPWSHENWYEDATLYHITSEGEAIGCDKYTDELAPITYEDYMNTNTYDDLMDEFSDILFADEMKTYNAEKVIKSLVETSGLNSRGNLCVYWNSGGGHSMVYEIDGSGNVSVLDCQINERMSIYDLIYTVSSFNFIRTDDKKLKKGVLDTIERN